MKYNLNLLRKEDIKVFHPTPGQYRFGTNMITLGWAKVHIGLDGSKSFCLLNNLEENQLFSSLEDIKEHLWSLVETSRERHR